MIVRGAFYFCSSLRVRDCYLEERFEGKAPLGNQLCERLSLHQLHRVEVDAPHFLHRVNVDDIRMVQSGNRFGLPLEPHELFARGHLRR